MDLAVVDVEEEAARRRQHAVRLHQPRPQKAEEVVEPVGVARVSPAGPSRLVDQLGAIPPSAEPHPVAGHVAALSSSAAASAAVRY